MCGIAGLIDGSVPAEAREAAVARMAAAMVHRGPDDRGIESKGEATLGMRRLAIFDPANGHQPMRTPDGRHTLVFNGSILNFRALRRELAADWTFRTDCDTEVLLAAFVHWGEECLERLRGMYAFAVWDDRERSLFLARDPFGIKPLYYRHLGEKIIFASELNALHAAGIWPMEIDPAAIADYLGWFSVPAPRTIYRNVQTLRPGESAVYRAGRLSVRRTWTFRGMPEDVPVCSSREEFVRELRERLTDTISAHVVADVPVGAFLSGGLDSAVVAGLMTKAGGAPLRTFSIGFDDPEFSEAEAAAESARHFGADHHTELLTGARVASEIERFVCACDQPTGDGLNTYYVSEAARAGGVTVALSGLGGDELFGGYPSFRDLPRLARWLPWWRALPRSLRRTIVRRLRAGDTRRRKLADFLQYAHDVQELASMQRRVFSEPRRRALLGPAASGAAEGLVPFHPELAALSEDLRDAGPLVLASAWELRTYMADLLLRDSDVMSMRHSLELRVPFVDRPFIEWLWRQRPAFRFDPSHPKRALADAVEDLLPPGVRDRPKRGFALPMANWMRAELRPFLDETFSDESIARTRFFERGPVQSSWRTFLGSSDTRHWSRVWSLAMLIAFVNRRTPAPPPSRLPPQVSTPPAPPAPSPRRSPVAHGSGFPSTLLMVPELFAGPGGIQRILQLYLRALGDLGAEAGRGVKLLALNDPVLDSGDIRRCVRGELTDWAVCNRDKRRFLREALRMSSGCDRIVCGHVAQLPVAWAASRVHRKARYYLVAHGIEVWRPFTLTERLALRSAARVFCVSDYTRQEMLHHAPLRTGRTVVLPNGLDPAFPIGPGQPLAECPPVILTVARLNHDDRYKGIEQLIEAMPSVRAEEPKAELRVVGRGDDLTRLQAVARRLGLLGSGVEFLGFIKDAEITREMRSCRLFALPSAKEGFGLVYIEAMAHGRPCLGANAAGAPEVITAETGVLTEPGDSRSIAAGVLAALRHPWDQEAILARARNFSYECFKRGLAEALAPAALASP